MESLQNEGEATLRGPSVVRGSARCHLGYGSSGEESSEGESILVGTDMGKNPSQDRKGSVGGQSPDDESGAVIEEIGNEGRGWSSNSA